MKKSNIFLLTGLLFLLLPFENRAQDSLRLYLNAGYITNIKKCDKCTKADAGGSVRIGILTKGKLGFYAGYLWFKEYHDASIDYDDEGYGFLAGIDFLLIKKGDFQGYIKPGIFIEKFKSTYRSHYEIDTETSIKPDLGLFININHFNAYAGWQPSAPPHFNIGVGATFNLYSQKNIH